MTPARLFDPLWEQIRFKYIQLYNLSRFTYSRTHVFQPGQIGYGDGSLEQAFFARLTEMGFKLAAREMPTSGNVPGRYCIVNKHIEGQKYEVFLMTTFGGAKSENELRLLGRYFGMPMGSTQWIDDTPGLATIPPLFGRDKASFAFAIPFVTTVSPPNLPTLTRLPFGELERLRKFSRSKLQTLPAVQSTIRQALRKYRFEQPPVQVSGVDDFKPLPIEKVNLIALEEDDLEEIRRHTSTFPPTKAKRLKLTARHDIRWPLQFFYRDIHGSKALDHQRRAPRQLSPIPKPYFAPCLPISFQKFKRLIR
ncbi:hypothetical protein CVT26_011197 [Gymnopilus dilepis]|uniref:Uncharacterized protein n=1 Tax=Gymnopilus dilepis TaxID=231916 RepID=A0A409VJI0_9AGAR|nr:hypothetical protein CVT26_011197 [Gymnopilus dilepis]